MNNQENEETTTKFLFTRILQEMRKGTSETKMLAIIVFFGIALVGLFMGFLSFVFATIGHPIASLIFLVAFSLGVMFFSFLKVEERDESNNREWYLHF